MTQLATDARIVFLPSGENLKRPVKNVVENHVFGVSLCAPSDCFYLYDCRLPPSHGAGCAAGLSPCALPGSFRRAVDGMLSRDTPIVARLTGFLRLLVCGCWPLFGSLFISFSRLEAVYSLLREQTAGVSARMQAESEQPSLQRSRERQTGNTSLLRCAHFGGEETRLHVFGSLAVQEWRSQMPMWYPINRGTPEHLSGSSASGRESTASCVTCCCAAGGETAELETNGSRHGGREDGLHMTCPHSDKAQKTLSRSAVDAAFRALR